MGQLQLQLHCEHKVAEELQKRKEEEGNLIMEEPQKKKKKQRRVKRLKGVVSSYFPAVQLFFIS